MKKFFTLIAAVAMAASVNAQGTYAVSEGETPASGSAVTSVPNITMTWGEDTWAGNKEVTGKFDDFTWKVTGSTNCTFDETNKLVPVSGAYVKFKATVDGTVSFAYKLNKNKSQYFVDENNNEVVTHIDETTGASVYNLTDIPVKAGVTYYTYTKGSKMDVFGFKFKATTAGISSVNAAEAKAEGATFNLLGQKVAANAKGLVVKNGKKFINK